jgi:hypothetical protein
MSILSFEKPKQVMTQEKRVEKYSSDCGIPGTYVPNMSDEDMNKWKAKHINGKDERVEIKKNFGGTQVVIVLYKYCQKGDWHNNVAHHDNIQISANSKIHMTLDLWNEFKQAIDEAREILSV